MWFILDLSSVFLLLVNLSAALVVVVASWNLVPVLIHGVSVAFGWLASCVVAGMCFWKICFVLISSIFEDF